MSHHAPALLLWLCLLVTCSSCHKACLEYGLDYPGNDMAGSPLTNVTTAEECQNLCKQKPGCEFFTWSPLTDPKCSSCRLQCWLKTSNSQQKVNAWRISGPATCLTKEALIFQDEFDSLNETTWRHLVAKPVSGQKEFQYYRNDRRNSYVKDGIFYLKPTFTATEFGEEFLEKGNLSLKEQGCKTYCNISHGRDIINPIQSAYLDTKKSFSFHYGRMEVSAMMPRGDWIRAGMFLGSDGNTYGPWPMSGQIDLNQAIGNDDYTCSGITQNNTYVSPALFCGLKGQIKGKSWKKYDTSNPYWNSFHKYELEWSDRYMAFKVDGDLIGVVRPPAGGFWELGKFDGPNIWSDGGRMAPFDRNFFILLKLNVGGTAFPDKCENKNGEKPWFKWSQTAMRDFWKRRSDWEKTWGGEGSDQSAMKIDYIRVYQRV